MIGGLLLITYIFIYNPLQDDIESLRAKVNYKRSLLIECQEYSNKVIEVEKEYKKLLGLEKDIIAQIHSKINENNIELKGFYHNKKGGSFNISLKIITTFKNFNQFCNELIGCIDYRPQVISISLLSISEDKLNSNMKLHFKRKAAEDE